MADQGKWFKLWVSSLNDPDLEELSLEDFGRWCRFGTYLKVHGTDGTMPFREPASALQRLFRVTCFGEVVRILKSFPNTHIDVTTATVTWQNWQKYQGDNSAERVANFRKRVTDDLLQVKRPKKRREEKRREQEEKKKEPPPPPFPDWLPLATWRAYLDMRAQIKKPMTAHALQVAIKTLDKLRQQGHHPEAVLDQSILHSWQGLFAVKEDNHGTHRSTSRGSSGPRTSVEENPRTPGKYDHLTTVLDVGGED